MRCTEHESERHREKTDPEGEVATADEVVEGVLDASDRAVEESGPRVDEVVTGRRCTGGGRGVGAAIGVDGEVDRSDIERRLQQIDRIVAQTVRHAARRHGWIDEADTVADRVDLVPPDATAVMGVGERDRGEGIDRRRSLEPTGEATGVQAGLSRLEREVGSRHGEGRRDSVHCQRDLRCDDRTLADGVLRSLGRLGLAVAVDVDRRSTLRRRDLGRIDDDVVDDEVGTDGQGVQTVDAEIAEGVGRGRRRCEADEQSGAGDRDREPSAAWGATRA